MTAAHALYDAAAMRALDRAAIDRCGIPGLELMRRAGGAAFALLRRRWPDAVTLRVVCGAGNNGGDGYVVAHLARAAGLAVVVLPVGDPARMGPDARVCRDAWLAGGGHESPDAGSLASADVIVDALFGIGLERPVEGAARATIEAINAAGRPILSLDVPSGIDASTGARRGVAVRASATVTFIAPKQGLLTGEAPDCVGTLELADLDVPPAAFEQVAPTAERLAFATVRDALGPRSRVAHKGDHGHVLIVGGAPGYAGAVRLAAEAALRTGGGLVSVAAHPQVASTLNAGRPEIMVHAAATAAELRPLLTRATVIAVGPGLGQGEWGMDLFAAVRGLRQPQVLDADALNLLASDPDRRPDRVMTPHPGEAARLLGCTTGDIRRDRFAAVRALAARYDGSVVLKGAGTLVYTGGLPAVLTEGNPGMASGGMGDVLTGIVAAAIAQGLPPPMAARYGAALHAAAGDRAAREGERGLLASDLLAQLRALVN